MIERKTRREVEPAPGVWDYEGAESPGRTLSFAVFQWRASRDGNYLIGGNVMRRFPCRPGKFDLVRELAENLCRELDSIEHISKCSDPQVRVNFSKDTAIGGEDLLLLLNDPDRKVRINVARHRNATDDMLDQLSHDPDPEVRAAVPFNPHAHVDILYKLAGDDNPAVGSSARRALKFRAESARRSSKPSDGPLNH